MISESYYHNGSSEPLDNDGTVELCYIRPKSNGNLTPTALTFRSQTSFSLILYDGFFLKQICFVIHFIDFQQTNRQLPLWSRGNNTSKGS